jgi:glycine C-acetyltransferase
MLLDLWGQKERVCLKGIVYNIRSFIYFSFLTFFLSLLLSLFLSFFHGKIGTDTHFGVKVDIINSTLGKALGGGTGGYTSGPQEIIDTLRQKARPYLFSNSLAPAMVGASIKVFDMLNNDSSFVETIRSNTHLFRDRMEEAGFTISGNRDHPICPVMLGDAKLASQMADAMLQRGVFVIGFSYPVVPQNQARIRCQISASHTEEQIHHTVDAFIEVGKEYGAI